MDGLKAGPILVGSYDITHTNQWLESVSPVIQTRINSYASIENDFNLLLITENIEPIIVSKITLIDQLLTNGNENNINKSDYIICKQEYQLYLSQCQMIKDQQKKENIRRRHNYIPFIFSLLNELMINKVINATDSSNNNNTVAATNNL